MANWAKVRRELARLRELGRAARDRSGRSGRYEWYGDGCPCGLECGECRIHPRARPNQRPPAGEWRTWQLLMGRGTGKTRSAAEWVRAEVESGRSRRLALVGATAADVRDVMIEGSSGLLSICPPWDRPRYEPSKRRLSWANGAVATCFSAEEPERLRGPQHDGAWVDELASFRHPAALDNLLLGLRLGSDPRLCVTTTPKPLKLVIDLVKDPTTAVSRGTTYENRAHLAPAFFDRIVTRFEGTRLGRQELLAEILEVSEGAWFSGFDPSRSVTGLAEYVPGLPVVLAIDCGVSRHVAAVWFQVGPRRWDLPAGIPGRSSPPITSAGWTGPPPVPLVPRFGERSTVSVFADFHCEGSFSEAAARAILRRGRELAGGAGTPDLVRLDPASTARTGVGPAAYGEFARVFGESIVGRWPSHRVADGLDQLEVLLDRGLLLVHPRCETLISSFRNYSRARGPGGAWLDTPADPQHPHEDVMDALRGGVRDRFPGGREEQGRLRSVSAGGV